MGRACRAQGGDKNAYKILVGKPEGKRRLGRRRHLLHLQFMESTVVYRLQFYSAGYVTRSRGSSGGIVSDYKLAKRQDFSYSLCVQTVSGAHPASCTMGTGGPCPGVKSGRGVTLTTHLSSSAKNNK
jgi:hypothetical protein